MGGSLCWRRRTVAFPTNAHVAAALRQELVHMYAPASRVQSAELACAAEAQTFAKVQYMRLAAALLDTVDWVAVVKAQAAAGYHALHIADPPWNFADRRTVAALRSAATQVQRQLHCGLAADDNIRLGDYAVGLLPSAGCMVISWATLEDAVQWRSLHGGRAHSCTIPAVQLVNLYGTPEARAQLATAAALVQAWLP